VNFEVTAALTYGITLSETGTYTFTAGTEGSYIPAARPVTITNSGSVATGALTIALAKAGLSDFTLSKTSITDIASPGNNTFNVTPKGGLAAGTYTDTVTVSGGNGINASFNVSFQVLSSTAGVTLDITFTVSDPSINYTYTGSPSPVSYNDIAGGLKSLTFTLDGGAFDNIKWYMDGTVVSTVTPLTINSSSTTILSKLTTGKHVLYVTGEKDGALYSAHVDFTITNK